MLLDVSHLTVRYGSQLPAISDVNLQLDNGEVLAVVGKSGSGKSTLLRTILGLLPDNGQIMSGSVMLSGMDLASLTPAMWQKIRGPRIGYVFQDAGASLNPVRKIGGQFIEYIRCHRKMSRVDAKRLALEMMQRMNLHDGYRIMRSYPSQLSGGMKQRVSIAMAMVFKPQLIIADEPTSALDTVSQAQIIDELLYLKETFGTAILLVTHNIGVAAHIADHIGIMNNGVMLECADTDKIMSMPKMEYTKELLKNIIGLNQKPMVLPGKKVESTIFSIKNVSKKYKAESRKETIMALDEFSLDIYRGEFLGIAGESGSGKSTLARLLLGLEKPDNGQIDFSGTDLARMSVSQKYEFIRQVQMVFQEPSSTFSPRMKIGTALKEPLVNFRLKARKELNITVINSLRSMLIPEAYATRYPHELSGGEQQRISIARCLEIQPEVILYDEPTSALDTAIQKRILDDIVDTHSKYGLTSVLISHDIALLRYACNRIVVLYRGHIMEILSGESSLSEARHPYTRELLSAVYSINTATTVQRYSLTDISDVRPSENGCVYYGRCCLRQEQCRLSMPNLKEYGTNMCACFFPNGGKQ